MTTEITKANMHEFVVTGEFDIESDVEGLKHILRFVCNQVPLPAIMGSSLKDKRINKQVQIRAHPERYPKGLLRVDYKGGRAPVDTTMAVVIEAEAAGMTPEEYLLAELKRRGLR